MTFNTQHCAAYQHGMVIDYPRFADAIKSLSPDVVLLQEIRSKGENLGYDDQTYELSRLTGMPHTKFAEAIRMSGVDPYGNSILSMLPLASSEVIAIPDPITRRNPKGYYETRCVLKAKLECGLTVLCVHVGLNPDEHENAIETLLREIEDERCVLVGDFNMRPDNPLIGRIRERLFDTGAMLPIDSATFPSDAPRYKIDYIFTSRDIKIERVYVPELVVSDHRPIVADISF